MWGIQMIWIPFWAAGIINGVGHALGYRNFDVKDESRNISPIAIWLGGEELHNNHHADPHSAKFKAKWYEFDIGWVYLQAALVLRPGEDRVRRGRNAVADVTCARCGQTREGFERRRFRDRSGPASSPRSAGSAGLTGESSRRC